MYVVQGRLTPEVGALLMRALEAASDALFEEQWVPGSGRPEDTEREAARRRADAVGLVAERAFAAGFGGETVEAPISGTQAERYLVVLNVDRETLSKDGDLGMSELEDGTRVSAETARRLACDCSVVELTRGPDGSVLDVGRKRRSTPPGLRRGLEARDRGCRFPGCNSRFTQAHHRGAPVAGDHARLV